MEQDCNDNQLWCLAWRLLRQHGEASERVIDDEIETCLKKNDRDNAAYWRKVAQAVVELRK